MNRFLRPFGFAILFAGLWLVACAGFSEEPPEGSEPTLSEKSIPHGYPKPIIFRDPSPESIQASGDWIQMVVSDHFVDRRRHSEEMYKQQFPDRPALIQVGGNFMSAGSYCAKQVFEDKGLYEGELKQKFIDDHAGYEEVLSEDFVPMPDFLGYWVYETGLKTPTPLPEGQQVVELKVEDPARFAPLDRTIPPGNLPVFERLTGSYLVNRIVVIYPRDSQGKPDWLRAELVEPIGVD
ncbi:hypothetical protein HQ520_18000, partial [bacterium]|nr:hypothetical protein [bacterium]